MSNHNSTFNGAVNKKQCFIINEIVNSGLWFLIPLINRFGFYQGKGWACFETQEQLAQSFGCERITINRLCMWMVKLGILKIKKVRYAGSQWLHNEYWLDPIMFTKTVVEGLFGITNHHYFKKYVSLSTVTLIKLNNSLFQNHSAKNNQSKNFGSQKTTKSRMWDDLLGGYW